MWRIPYLLIFGLGLASIILLCSGKSSPERKIVGEWKELTWSYQMLSDTAANDTQIQGAVAQELGEDMLVHKAETWHFYPNGILKLKSKTCEKQLKWHLKGRGNVLQITFDGNKTENYLLSELSSTKMNLDYESAVQVKGIAKLSFQRIN